MYGGKIGGGIAGGAGLAGLASTGSSIPVGFIILASIAIAVGALIIVRTVYRNRRHNVANGR
ncbi:hypothetical protein GCM10027414_17930 [Humibacter ginsengiterrae]|jgi:hypothetical protein